MSEVAIVVVIVFLAVGLVLGWYSNKTSQAHGDVKVAKTRLRGGRRTRWRSAVVVVILGLITLLAVKDVLHPR
ncbi:MAG: hypothetical protein ACLQFR_24455 [Streptosporangiaceae bacterium]